MGDNGKTSDLVHGNATLNYGYLDLHLSRGQEGFELQQAIRRHISTAMKNRSHDSELFVRKIIRMEAEIENERDEKKDMRLLIAALENELDVANDYREGAKKRIKELKAENKTVIENNEGLQEIIKGHWGKITSLRAEIAQLQADTRTLADAVLQADSTICNDLYATRASNAHGILEEVNDVALNWMSEPGD